MNSAPAMANPLKRVSVSIAKPASAGLIVSAMSELMAPHQATTSYLPLSERRRHEAVGAIDPSNQPAIRIPKVAFF